MVTIGNVKGVQDTSILDPEPGPQGPFITYSYYVTYDFVEEEEGEGSEYGGVLAEVCDPGALAPLPRNWGLGGGGRAGLHWGPQGVLRRQNSFSASWGPGNPFTGSFLIHTLLREGKRLVQPLS